MKKILVIQTAFIGDAILATAVLEKLHSHEPKDVLDILIRKGNESLFKGHPFINEVRVWDKTSNKYSHLLSLIRSIRRAQYDAVINLQRFVSTGLLTAFSGAAYKAGFDKNPMSPFFSYKARHTMDGNKHETERNHELIRSLTDDHAGRPKLYPGDGDIEAVKTLASGPYYCMAPGSQWFTKAWPEAQWLELISKLPEAHTIFLLGSAADRTLCDRITEKSAGHKIRNMAAKLSLLESAALMAGAKMNYVNDSAPLHLASAVNAPVCAIYCSTVPAYGFGPLSDNGKVVETKEKLSCRPCGLHGRTSCPQNHFRCALTIQVEDML